MGKIGGAFGKKKGPPTIEIFTALAKKAEDEKKEKARLAKFNANQKKLAGGRAKRLGVGGKDDEDKIASIQRPGARTAELLGS